MKNPFSLSFGREPAQYISKNMDMDQVITAFSSNPPLNQACMISGIRGSGKTVFMTAISNRLKSQDWIVILLNPERDMLNALAAKLYNETSLYKYFLKAKIDLSVLGIGLSIEKAIPISDVEVAIERMLEIVKKRNKKVLIAIDEVSSNKYMRQFAAAFQIFIRQDFPIFILMTGLYKNINRLRNEKSLTFLYRSLGLDMKSLSLPVVASHYKRIFNTSDETAGIIASYTRGYPFAFQVLGHLLWEAGSTNPLDVMDEYDLFLAEYAYDKIWSEISPKCKSVILAMARIGGDEIKNSDIREQMDCTSNQFTGYRDLLLKEGVIHSEIYGYLSFSLPRFGEYAIKRAV